MILVQLELLFFDVLHLEQKIYLQLNFLTATLSTYFGINWKKNCLNFLQPEIFLPNNVQ
jgi:hypothetical protein